uniref:Uncharacterized protein n=1 Tax=Fagus sylvatica TaxID=28930 RepID=A0A2N9I7W9_FAGSY
MEGNGLVDTERTSNEQKHSKGGCNAAIFIIFVEVAERFAFYSMVGNLIIYLTDELHEPITMAAKNFYTWSGASYIFPLFGAFIADSFLGRFKTIILSSIIYCMHFTYHQWVKVGTSPCVTTFAADQFDENSRKRRGPKVPSSIGGVLG